MTRVIYFLLISIITINATAQIKHLNPTLDVVTKPNGGDKKFDIIFVNSSNENITVFWELVKDNKTWNTKWESYICDLAFCYAPNVDKSSPSLPNEFKPGENKIEFHIDAKGIQGVSEVEYKLYKDKDFKVLLYSAKLTVQSTFISHKPDPLVIETKPNTGDNKLNITFNNSSDTTYQVFWKLFKSPTTWKTQWDTYVCDIAFCYANNIDASAPQLPNEFKKGDHLIEFHFFPNGVEGNTTVTMKLYRDKDFKTEIYSTDILIKNLLTNSVNEALVNSISLSPNPAHNYVNISSLESVSKIQILNIEGKIISILDNLDSNGVDVSNLENGIYLFQFFDVKGSPFGMKKFVKI